MSVCLSVWIVVYVCLLTVCFCWSSSCIFVCRFLRAFVMLPSVKIPYLIGVVSFMDVLCELGEFAPTAPLDKFITYDITKFSPNFWKQLRPLKIYDMLIFLDDPPNFFPNSSPPPSFLIPPGIEPPPTHRQPTRRRLLQDIPSMDWTSTKLTTTYRHSNCFEHFCEHFWEH